MSNEPKHIRITQLIHRWLHVGAKTSFKSGDSTENHLAIYCLNLSKFLAMLLALTAGILHVGHLWLAPLAVDTLLDAGEGVILLLIALGLMGSARLSLILVCLFCVGSLLDLIAISASMSVTSWVEVSLLLFAISALLLQLLSSIED